MDLAISIFTNPDFDSKVALEAGRKAVEYLDTLRGQREVHGRGCEASITNDQLPIYRKIYDKHGEEM